MDPSLLRSNSKIRETLNILYAQLLSGNLSTSTWALERHKDKKPLLSLLALRRDHLDLQSRAIEESTYPPRYSTVFDNLPSTDTHYSFHLKNSKGKKWVYIHLRNSGKNRPSGTPKNMPIFAEGPNRTLSGFVTIDLESPETIQSLTLAVRGRTITGANEGGMHLFLDHIVPLWSKDQGDPHAYAYRTGLDSSSPPRSPPGRSSKLFGTYSFPFSFYLPTAFDSGPWGAGALPESFHERSSGVRVQYELVLKIGRGKLRTDAKLQVPIFYCRKIAPSAASELRQAAYRDNTTPPGPDIDPYGWSTFSPVDCIGSLLNSRL
ncbi:hypothetical protein BT96DRAFT_154488 [Gymnopus androsaceus JB14]|uniref:Arrestin-like N-terminal domain-containing protein n=1 Tax=Gymnopus androsaceus JB14 TaxID=1447944 RepID=A0A6A4HAW8_9AGAR|nr:hypothetical protein BT96DRAFT_154488 [Gymnopus androsaceus JB14]